MRHSHTFHLTLERSRRLDLIDCPDIPEVISYAPLRAFNHSQLQGAPENHLSNLAAYSLRDLPYRAIHPHPHLLRALPPRCRVTHSHGPYQLKVIVATIKHLRDPMRASHPAILALTAPWYLSTFQPPNFIARSLKSSCDF